VEIDRCATHAVACMTGCALGQARAVKFRDGGRHRLAPSISVRLFEVEIKIAIG